MDEEHQETGGQGGAPAEEADARREWKTPELNVEDVGGVTEGGPFADVAEEPLYHS